MMQYKKWFILLLIPLALLVRVNSAYAYDTTDINNYISVDSLYIDHTGQLNTSYHRNVASSLNGFEGYITLTINGTSSSGYYPNKLDTIHFGSACAVATNDFGTIAQIPYAQNYVTNTIWDSSLGAYVPTTDITVTTPISFNMIYYLQDTYHCYSDGVAHYQSSLTYVPQFVATTVTGELILPVDGSTYNNPPYWETSLNFSNAEDFIGASGTVEVRYGTINTSTWPIIDSSTYYIDGTENSRSIYIPVGVSTTNAFASTTWYAQLGVSVGTSTMIYQDPITFYTDPTASTSTYGGYSPTLSIVFPTNLSTGNPPFEAWLVNVQNNINNASNTGENPFIDIAEFNASDTTYTNAVNACNNINNYIYGITDKTNATIQYVTRMANAPNSTSTDIISYYACASLINSSPISSDGITTYGQHIVAVSPVVQYSIDYSQEYIYNDKSGSEGTLPPSNPVTIMTCNAPSSILDFGSDFDYARCGVQNFISSIGGSISGDASGAVGDTYNTFKSIFPISIIANFNTDIGIAETYSNSTSSQPLTLKGQEIMDASSGLPTGQYTFGGYTMPVLSSTTTSWIQTKSGFDYRGVIDNILYGLTGLIMLGGAIGVVVMIHKTTAGV